MNKQTRVHNRYLSDERKNSKKVDEKEIKCLSKQQIKDKIRRFYDEHVANKPYSKLQEGKSGGFNPSLSLDLKLSSLKRRGEY